VEEKRRFGGVLRKKTAVWSKLVNKDDVGDGPPKTFAETDPKSGCFRVSLPAQMEDGTPVDDMVTFIFNVSMVLFLGYYIVYFILYFSSETPPIFD
jgi:hypothetical protein